MLTRSASAPNSMPDGPAFDTTTAILLDEGEIGEELGLGPAVQAIRIALELARGRPQKWQRPR
jgi:hypothetical protein